VFAMKESGIDPFPKSHFDWRHPLKKRDGRLFLCEYPVSISMDCSIGQVGITSTTPFPEGDTDVTPMGPDRKPMDSTIKELASAATGTPTDVLVMAMDGIEKCNHVVVLRWYPSGTFDSFSTFNKLELPTVLHKALSSMINGGQ
jgi:hypothetical protein